VGLKRSWVAQCRAVAHEAPLLRLRVLRSLKGLPKFNRRLKKLT
jgi:hypothetical protein